MNPGNPQTLAIDLAGLHVSAVGSTAIYAVIALAALFFFARFFKMAYRARVSAGQKEPQADRMTALRIEDGKAVK